jgi:hypothetical protein
MFQGTGCFLQAVRDGKGRTMLAAISISTQPFANWGWDKYVILAAPLGLVALAALMFLLLRNMLRTRFRMARQLDLDQDVNDWLICFDWSSKVLYLPAIVMSFVGALAMLMIQWKVIPEQPVAQTVAQVIGGLWLLAFMISFLVDEYEMSLKVLAFIVLVMLLLVLWLHLLGWLVAFLRLLGRVSVSMSWQGFLFIGLLFSVGIVVSWIKGLFYYVAITPNYMNIQVGLTESSEQISREDYSTRVDTGDLLERIMGFGRIIITFRDNRRLPMCLLVGRIGRKTTTLESLRGKLAVDAYQPPHEARGGD